jgi:hypothetical protein
MKNNIDKDDLKNQKKHCTTKPIANWAERLSFVPLKGYFAHDLTSVRHFVFSKN